MLRSLKTKAYLIGKAYFVGDSITIQNQTLIILERLSFEEDDNVTCDFQKMLEMNFSQFSSVEAQFLGKTIALFVGSGNETLYQVYDPWSNDLTDMKSLGTPVENITAVLFPGMNTLPQNAKIGPIVYIEVLY